MRLECFHASKGHGNAAFLLLIAIATQIGPLSWSRGQLKFEKVVEEADTPIHSATALYQDEKGYMYIGTQQGLYVTNGYHFRRYIYDAENTDTISGDWITAISPGKDGRIWLGTRSGLNRFDKKTGKFRRFVSYNTAFNREHIRGIGIDARDRVWVATRSDIYLYNDIDDIFEHREIPAASRGTATTVSSLLVDKNGIMWMGTESAGLIRFDPIRNHFNRFRYDEKDLSSLRGDRISCIAEDRQGRLWIGCNTRPGSGEEEAQGGLNLYPLGFDEFEELMVSELYDQLLAGDEFTSMHVDQSGDIWIGMLSGDLYVIDSKSLETKRLPDGKNGNSKVTCIYEDRSRTLWVGHKFDSLYRGNKTNQHFYSWGADSVSKESLSDLHVTSVLEDRYGDLWIGTMSGGLNRIRADGTAITTYKNDPSDSDSLPYNRVTEIYEDSRGNLWVATFRNGFSLFDREKESFVLRYNRDETPESLSNGTVADIFEDSKGRYWISTYGGLNEFIPETGTFQRYLQDTKERNGTSRNKIYCVMEDSLGMLWIGTDKGACIMNPETKEYKYLAKAEGEWGGLSMNKVRCIYEGSRGYIWIGTRSGLNRYDRFSESVKSYFTQDGLAGNVVFGIQEDSTGVLWVSTANGLCRMDPSDDTFFSLGRDSGLVNSSFEMDSFCKGIDDRLYFGGPSGLDSFLPIEVKIESESPQMALFSIRKYGEVLHSWNELQDSETIEIGTADNFVSFEYSALDFINPNKNQYRYILDGFDSDWTFAGNRHYANYTNLPSGNYTFRVQGTNSKGIWSSKEASVGLNITPALWQTFWFRALSFLGLFAVALLVFIATRRRFERTKWLISVSSERIERLELELSHLRDVFCSDVLSVFWGGHSEAQLGKDRLRVLRSGIDQVDEVFESIEHSENGSKGSHSRIELKQLIENATNDAQRLLTSRSIHVSCFISDDVPEWVESDPVCIHNLLRTMMLRSGSLGDKGNLRLDVCVIEKGEDVVTLHFSINRKAVFARSLLAEGERGNAFDRIRRRAVSSLANRLEAQWGEEPLDELRTIHWFAAPLKLEFSGDENLAINYRKVRETFLSLSRAKRRALLIDDNPQRLRQSKEMLSDAGYLVTAVFDGQQGLYASSRESYQLFVFNCQNTVLDGVALARRFRDQEKGNERTPILGLLEQSSTATRNKHIAAGVDDCLVYPIVSGQLEEKLKKIEVVSKAV